MLWVYREHFLLINRISTLSFPVTYDGTLYAFVLQYETILYFTLLYFIDAIYLKQTVHRSN